MILRKIIVASDSFKGSLTSAQVAESVKVGILEVFPDCKVQKVIIADGGEGTVEAIIQAINGNLVKVMVHDPLGRVIEAHYGVSGKTAILEMAEASGLTLLTNDERNPLLTSTYGTGEMILDAIKRGCTEILVGIGGSATNDAGLGMLEALGYRFYNSQGDIINNCCGKDLKNISKIDDSLVSEAVHSVNFVVACDVDTVFYGQSGAAFLFARQKGANDDIIKQLDSGMASLAKVIESKFDINIQSISGSGAAGGLGGAFYSFLNARLTRGIEMVLDKIKFDDLLTDADLVITGEGKIDHQTPQGKAVAGVLHHAQKFGIPVIAIGGRVEMSKAISNMGFYNIYQVSNDNMPIEMAMETEIAQNNVKTTITKALAIIKHSKKPHF